MSKRKNRNNIPNIPESTLERARRQLAEQSGLKAAETTERAEPTPVTPAETAEPAASAPKMNATANRAGNGSPNVAIRTRSSRRSGAQQIQGRGGREPDKLDQAYIRSRLDNPTRVVTEAQLRQEYGYVARDLRWLFGLAFALIAAMIIVGQLLGRT